ncbi:MAG: hypothetical protein H6891_13675 [Brucellaceae bacterium]|nr:hypothetical protein [Brucellaceae bacterium]
MDWIKDFKEVWPLMSQAPFVFLGIATALSGLVYWLVRLHFSQQIATLNERIKLKDEQISDLRQKAEKLKASENAHLEAAQNEYNQAQTPEAYRDLMMAIARKKLSED